LILPERTIPLVLYWWLSSSLHGQGLYLPDLNMACPQHTQLIIEFVISRYAFPCFDEPGLSCCWTCTILYYMHLISLIFCIIAAMRATFQFTFNVPTTDNLTVITNTKESTVTEHPNGMTVCSSAHGISLCPS
jgi:hypothetical protein